MPTVVNLNISSLIAQRNLALNKAKVEVSFEKLASGYRINRATDDATGLTISEKLRGQIRGLSQANQNLQDGISILQTAEGTLSVVVDNLHRVRELVIQAASDANDTTQRNAIEDEIKARLEDNQRIVQAAQFNGINLLTGALASARIQIGADSDITENTLDIASALASASMTAIGLLGAATSAGWTTISAINFTDNAISRRFLTDVDNAIRTVASRRGKIGSYQNQLETSEQNLMLTTENLAGSESKIRNVDVAEETAHLSKNQILEQAALSILVQANQTPALVLRLLQ